jgi:hypothetical protein
MRAVQGFAGGVLIPLNLLTCVIKHDLPRSARHPVGFCAATR